MELLVQKKKLSCKKYGYDEVINYSKDNFPKKVKELTDGKGVPVVYDGVGKDTLEGSSRMFKNKRNDGFIWKCFRTTRQILMFQKCYNQKDCSL